MATHYRMRCAFQYVDDDPKNVAVINPCFRATWDPFGGTFGTDTQALVDDLATALNTWQVTPKGQITVKAYRADGPPPHPPLAVKTLNAGAYRTPACPPQQAICLSYFGDSNTVGKRGRLYVPAWLATTASGDLAFATVPPTLRAKVAVLKDNFAALGGANVDWIVWSQTTQTANRVQNWWVDEGWDIIRSRKLKAKVRDTGTTSG